MPAPTSPLLYVAAAFALISLICSLFVVIKTVIRHFPQISAHPLYRGQQAIVARPLPPRVRSAQRFQLWLAAADILACWTLVWEVLVHGHDFSDPAKRGPTPSSAARLFFSLEARQTILFVVAVLIFVHVRRGRKVKLGRGDWMLTAPAFCAVVVGTALAGVAAHEHWGRLWVGIMVYSTVVAVATAGVFSTLLYAVLTVHKRRRQSTAVPVRYHRYSDSDVEINPHSFDVARPSNSSSEARSSAAAKADAAGTFEVKGQPDLGKQGAHFEGSSSWLESTRDSRSTMSSFSYGTSDRASRRRSDCSRYSQADESGLFGDSWLSEHPSDVDRRTMSSFDFGSTPAASVEDHSPASSSRRSGSSWLSEHPSDRDRPTMSSFKFSSRANSPDHSHSLHSVDPSSGQAVFRPSSSWLSSTNSPRPSISSFLYSNESRPSQSSQGHTPESSASHGTTSSELLARRKAYSASIRSASSSIELSRKEAHAAVARLGGHLLCMLLPYVLALPYLASSLSTSGSSTGTIYAFVLSVMVSGPLLAFQVGMTEGFCSHTTEPQAVRERPRTMLSITDVDATQFRTRPAPTMKNRRPVTLFETSSAKWIQQGDAVDGLSRLGRAMSLLAPHPPLSVLPSRAVTDSPETGRAATGARSGRSSLETTQTGISSSLYDFSRSFRTKTSVSFAPSPDKSGRNTPTSSYKRASSTWSIDTLSAKILPRLVPSISIGSRTRVHSDPTLLGLYEPDASADFGPLPPVPAVPERWRTASAAVGRAKTPDDPPGLGRVSPRESAARRRGSKAYNSLPAIGAGQLSAGRWSTGVERLLDNSMFSTSASLYDPAKPSQGDDSGEQQLDDVDLNTPDDPYDRPPSSADFFPTSRSPSPSFLRPERRPSFTRPNPSLETLQEADERSSARPSADTTHLRGWSDASLLGPSALRAVDKDMPRKSDESTASSWSDVSSNLAPLVPVQQNDNRRQNSLAARFKAIMPRVTEQPEDGSGSGSGRQSPSFRPLLLGERTNSPTPPPRSKSPQPQKERNIKAERRTSGISSGRENASPRKRRSAIAPSSGVDENAEDGLPEVAVRPPSDTFSKPFSYSFR